MFRKLTSRALALAMVGLFAVSGVALALNGSANSTFSARQNTTQQTNYYRFTLNYNDARISTGVKFGRLPNNAFVDAIKCHVTTAFNAGASNAVTVGTTATGVEIFGLTDLNELSATVQNLSSANGLGLTATSAGEVDLYARYTYGSTAPSAGAVTCSIPYIPNNDQ
jgi:hypothetical protein